jgi:hypothetical protein
LSTLELIRSLVRNGLYYLTQHAEEEADSEWFDIHDVEYGLLNGRISKSWPNEKKYEIAGPALDGRIIGVVCRITVEK